MLRKYRAEAARISEIAGSLDNNYNTLDNDMKTGCMFLPTGDIKEKERRIVI